MSVGRGRRPGDICRLLAVVSLLALTAAPACEDEYECAGDEQVRVSMAGECASEPRTFTLARRFRCEISVEAPSGPTGLPASGALGQARHPIRKGGWQLYGYLCGDGTTLCEAPGTFRRCTAERVEWRIELACTDGTGAPVCRATLTE